MRKSNVKIIHYRFFFFFIHYRKNVENVLLHFFLRWLTIRKITYLVNILFISFIFTFTQEKENRPLRYDHGEPIFKKPLPPQPSQVRGDFALYDSHLDSTKDDFSGSECGSRMVKRKVLRYKEHFTHWVSRQCQFVLVIMFVDLIIES